MDTARTIAAARTRAGMTQTQLARSAGTSQATISAYESGRKQPSLATMERLLLAAGSRLVVEPSAPAAAASERQLRQAARTLSDVLALAAALPTRHPAELRYPRLPVRP